jgi:phenylalanyl-tRNA synthetase beta chain
MSILVDEKVALDRLLKAMKDEAIPFVTDIALFDLYRGKGVPEDKKSLAFLVLMQDSQKSLTDAEADKVMADLLSVVKDGFAAELR